MIPSFATKALKTHLSASKKRDADALARTFTAPLPKIQSRPPPSPYKVDSWLDKALWEHNVVVDRFREMYVLIWDQTMVGGGGWRTYWIGQGDSVDTVHTVLNHLDSFKRFGRATTGEHSKQAHDIVHRYRLRFNPQARSSYHPLMELIELLERYPAQLAVNFPIIIDDGSDPEDDGGTLPLGVQRITFELTLSYTSDDMLPQDLSRVRNLYRPILGETWEFYRIMPQRHIGLLGSTINSRGRIFDRRGTKQLVIENAFDLSSFQWVIPAIHQDAGLVSTRQPVVHMEMSDDREPRITIAIVNTLSNIPISINKFFTIYFDPRSLQ